MKIQQSYNEVSEYVQSIKEKSKGHKGTIDCSDWLAVTSQGSDETASPEGLEIGTSEANGAAPEAQAASEAKPKRRRRAPTP